MKLLRIGTLALLVVMGIWLALFSAGGDGPERATAQEAGNAQSADRNTGNSESARDAAQFPELERVEVRDVVDGDTLRLEEFRGEQAPLVNLAGINAPEFNQQGGEAALDYLDGLITEAGGTVYLLVPERNTDYYGRNLAWGFVSADNGDLISLDLQMVEAGHAEPWQQGEQETGTDQQSN